MRNALLAGLAVVVSVLVVALVPRPSGLGREEATLGRPAWRVVKQPPLVIPEWRLDLPDLVPPDVEADEYLAIVAKAPSEIRSGETAGALLDMTFSVLYDRSELDIHGLPEDFEPGIMGPEDVALLLDGTVQVANRLSARQQAVQGAVDTFVAVLTPKLNRLRKGQRSLAKEARGNPKSQSLQRDQEQVQGGIDAIEALAVRVSSDVAVVEERLGEVQSHFQAFHRVLCDRAGLVSRDGPVASRVTRWRRPSRSAVGNAIVLAVHAKEPWLRRYAREQLDSWQWLYPEAEATLQWIQEDEGAPGVAYADAAPLLTQRAEGEPDEVVPQSPQPEPRQGAEPADTEAEPDGHSEGKPAAESPQEPQPDAQADANDPRFQILGYVPGPADQNMARVTAAASSITAVIGNVALEELAAEARKVLPALQQNIPGLTMLNAIESLAQEARVLAAETAGQAGTSLKDDPKARLQELGARLDARAENDRGLYEAAKMIHANVALNQGAASAEILVALAAEIAEIQRAFPEGESRRSYDRRDRWREIAYSTLSIYRARRSSDPSFTVWAAFGVLRQELSRQTR